MPQLPAGPVRPFVLVDADGRHYASRTPGTLGGHRGLRIYGRLDCPSALRALARGHYARHRVFFADEASAVAAGYRPCARCLPDRYAAWVRNRCGRAVFCRANREGRNRCPTPSSTTPWSGR